MSRCLLSSSQAGGSGMGPAGAGPGAQGAHHWAALLPTCSGPATTRLLSYDAVMVGRAQKRPCRGAATEGVPARKPMSAEYHQLGSKSTKKRISAARDEGMGPLVSIRAFSDGYHGASIEHSQMDTRESPSSIL